MHVTYVKFDSSLEDLFFPSIRKPEELLGKVSWSDKSVQYYLHVIDHSKLAHFYEKMHQLHAKGIRSL